MSEDLTYAAEAPGPDEASTLELPHMISCSLNSTGQFYLLI